MLKENTGKVLISMQTLRRMYKRMKGLHRFAKTSIRLGFSLMCAFYILAAATLLWAPHAADYFAAMHLHRGFLEVAPAFLAVGVCAGLLGDLVLSAKKTDGDPPREE